MVRAWWRQAATTTVLEVQQTHPEDLTVGQVIQSDLLQALPVNGCGFTTPMVTNVHTDITPADQGGLRIRTYRNTRMSVRRRRAGPVYKVQHRWRLRRRLLF